jgi:hypothetical protein
MAAATVVADIPAARHPEKQPAKLLHKTLETPL